MYRDGTSAWSAMTYDPLGVLLPAAGALLVDVGLGVSLRLVWGDPGFVAYVGAALLVRPLLQAPFRAAMLAAGARAVRPNADAGVLSSVRLAFVDVVRSVVSVALAGLVLVPVALVGTWLASRGLYLFASIFVAAGLVFAATLALLGRAVLAYAPVDVVVGRCGAFEALGRSWTTLSPDVAVTALFLLVGDVATGLGGAMCAAGALPGYPLAELALVSRWAARQPVIPVPGLA